MSEISAKTPMATGSVGPISKAPAVSQTPPVLETWKEDRARLSLILEAKGGQDVKLAEEIARLDAQIESMERGKKFYCLKIVVTVITDRDWQPRTLEQVHYEITDGDFSGEWEILEHRQIPPKEAARLCLEQGSDPNFFGLTEDGKLEDDEDDEDGEEEADAGSAAGAAGDGHPAGGDPPADAGP